MTVHDLRLGLGRSSVGLLVLHEEGRKENARGGEEDAVLSHVSQ